MKASLERGSRAEAVEQAAFCLRGREVSTIAVYDAEYKKLVASLEARLVEADEAKAELVARLGVSEESKSELVESSMMEVSLEARLEDEGTARTSLESKLEDASTAESSSCSGGSRRGLSRLFLEEDLRSPQLFQVIVTVCH